MQIGEYDMELGALHWIYNVEPLLNIYNMSILVNILLFVLQRLLLKYALFENLR